MIVNMPGNRAAYTEAGWKNVQDATANTRDLFQADAEAEILDATEVVPGQHFYAYRGAGAKGAAGHMNPTGHALFAKWLAGRILESEEEPP